MTPQANAPIARAVGEMGGGDPADPFSQERAGLRAAAAPVTAVPGTDLPDPPMLDAGGTATSVSAARAGRPAVVVLYRGAWCPFCNVALRVYREQLQPELLARGIALIAVSPQHPDGSLTMREKHDLDFAVLSDPGNRLAISLGVLTAPSPEAREAQLALGLDLEAVNADGTTGLPMPTTAIVDGAGRLVWIDVHPDYATRTEPHQVLDALDGLGIQGGVRG